MLQLNIASFSYPEMPKTPVLQDVSFTLKEGEHLAILGESGCGKSTLLHLIYGLFHLDHGTITYKSKKLLGPNHNLIPGEPFMKLVSQDLGVMPFTSVAENIASHLDRNDKEKDNARVDELLAVVQLSKYKHVKVKSLSGGQKQRVAIAKALAQKPEILLLDEPFSSIDTFLKNKIRRSIYAYTRRQKIMCIIATHDSEESLSFSDTVLILKEGKTQKMGTPQAVYNSINSPYDGSFFGDVSVIKNKSYLPHQLKISEEKTTLKMVVTASYYLGHCYLVEGTIANSACYVHHTNELQKDTEVYIITNDSN